MATATIVIKDEVNVKIDGLDLDTRKDLVKKFKYFDQSAKFTPLHRLGRWDGCVGFFGLGGVSYVNLLDQIIPLIIKAGYEIKVDDQRQSEPLEFVEIKEDFWGNQTWPKGHRYENCLIRLRDDQVHVINSFLKDPQALQEVATGAGKCQPMSSKVLTSNGWSTMKDIKVGDTVRTPAGKLVKVLKTYEPGIKEVYKITFADGRYALSCEDHIWPIYNIEWNRSNTGPWRNLSLKEVIKLKNSTKRSIGIPLVTMEKDNSDIELPIDPWLLGFLLGDGSFRNGKICFSSADSELVEKVSSKLDENYKVSHIANYDYCIKFSSKEIQNASHSLHLSNKRRNNLGHIISESRYNSSSNKYRQLINELGLGETYSNNKFIPEIYFNASISQRLELIRGLVDSDGTVDKSSVKFTSVSKNLAEGFQRLIHSVGGIAKIMNKTNSTYMYKGIRRPCQDSYTVATKFPKPWELISLTRKKDATNYKYQYGSTLKLNITNIEKHSTELVKCIYIDDPSHLYVTNDYIVTHNTIITATLSKICEKYGRTITIVPNKDLVEQTEEDFINVGLDVGVYYGNRKELHKTHTICTWQSLNILDKKTKNDEATIITLAEFLENVNTVIVDEVHQAKAKVLKSLLTQNLRNAPIRWGLTGTVPKDPLEFESIRCSIGNVINRLTAHDLQEKGVLSNCHVNVLQTQEWKEFGSYAEELKYLVTDSARLQWMSNFIKEVSSTGNTLVLVDRIESGKVLQKQLSSLFSVLKEEPDISFVSGSIKSKDRKKVYKDVATSDNQIIIATYGVAAVGLNIPRIFNIVLVEPGKSFVRVIQSIGRGLRVADDKDFVSIYDITASSKYSKRHLTERKKFYKDAQYKFNITKIDITK